MSVASVIDHTLLKPEATSSDIDRLCDEALEFGFATVCVNGYWVERCADLLKDSRVGVGSVVDFPLGASPSVVKMMQGRELVDRGATELDMVAQLGPIKSGDWERVGGDIAFVASVVSVPIKVIIETAMLTGDEITQASIVARDAGAAFIKTSTGLHPAGGATVDAVRAIRQAVGDGVGVKASGGIRDRAAALAMLEAGATRIGTSSGVAIVTDL